MITLWHCVDARSFRALWALEEVGVPYRIEILPFPPRYRAREYLQVNPLGTIPFMIDGDTRMSESAAICQYLAERYAGPPLAVRPDEPGFGDYLNGLHFGEATLMFPQAIMLRYGRFEPPERRIPQAVSDYARWTVARLKALEILMGAADYVAAGRFTVADISIGYALMMMKLTGIFSEAPDSFQAYYARVKARPAFKRAKAAQSHAASEKGVDLSLPGDVAASTAQGDGAAPRTG